MGAKMRKQQCCSCFGTDDVLRNLLGLLGGIAATIWQTCLLSDTQQRQTILTINGARQRPTCDVIMPAKNN